MEAAHAATMETTHAAMETTTTTAVEAAATAMATTTTVAEGHRAGRHRCCQSHGHRACEKLFPHEILLNSVAHQYRLANQRQPRPSGCGKGTAERLKLLL
jgi:hypothetical protein